MLFRSGLKVEEPVQLVDVMPTLLEMSGLRAPEGVQGRSLQPLLRGAGATPASGGWKRRPLIAEKQPFSDTDHPNATEAYAIMDGKWKLIQNVARPPEKPEFELFDFYADPLDQINLASSHPDVVAKMAKELAGFDNFYFETCNEPYFGGPTLEWQRHVARTIR